MQSRLLCRLCSAHSMLCRLWRQVYGRCGDRPILGRDAICRTNWRTQRDCRLSGTARHRSPAVRRKTHSSAKRNRPNLSSTSGSTQLYSCVERYKYHKSANCTVAGEMSRSSGNPTTTADESLCVTRVVTPFTYFILRIMFLVPITSVSVISVHPILPELI